MRRPRLLVLAARERDAQRPRAALRRADHQRPPAAADVQERLPRAASAACRARSRAWRAARLVERRDAVVPVGARVDQVVAQERAVERDRLVVVEADRRRVAGLGVALAAQARTPSSSALRRRRQPRQLGDQRGQRELARGGRRCARARRCAASMSPSMSSQPSTKARPGDEVERRRQRGAQRERRGEDERERRLGRRDGGAVPQPHRHVAAEPFAEQRRAGRRCDRSAAGSLATVAMAPAFEPRRAARRLRTARGAGRARSRGG